MIVVRLHEFVGTGHRDAASQAILLMRSPAVDTDRLERRASAEGLTDALAALRGLSSRVNAGELLETPELHAIARQLRRG